MDYHDEMDGEIFEKWFSEQLLPNLEKDTVIIMDNAHYHSRRVERVPTTAWNVGHIKEWLSSKNIEFAEDSLKKELLALVNSVRDQYSIYKVDRMAEERGYTVCRLPPYHCELNPVELVWSQVKRDVAKHNVKFKENLMEGLINDALSRVTASQWKNYCHHVLNE